MLRRCRPEAFAGAYEPLDAGERTVAFLRGGEVLAAAAVRGDGEPVDAAGRPLARRALGGEHGGGAATRRVGIALLERRVKLRSAVSTGCC